MLMSFQAMIAVSHIFIYIHHQHLLNIIFVVASIAHAKQIYSEDNYLEISNPYAEGGVGGLRIT